MRSDLDNRYGSHVSKKSTKSLRSKSNLKPSFNVSPSNTGRCMCPQNSRYSIVSSNRQLTQVACVENGPDIYRSVLGPTPDETVLAGLQTVIDLCTVAYPQRDPSRKSLIPSPSKSGRNSIASSRKSRRSSTFASPQPSTEGSYKSPRSTGGSVASPDDSMDDNLSSQYPEASLLSSERQLTDQDVNYSLDNDYSNIVDDLDEERSRSLDVTVGDDNQEIIDDIQSYLKSQEAVENYSITKSRSVRFNRDTNLRNYLLF